MRPELEDTLAAPSSDVGDVGRTATRPGSRSTGETEAATALVAGQQLGHFRIERQLGAGGMGEVYLATDLALDRPVAIKVLPPALARDPTRRDRMVREARAQARVNHPNIGHIYFIGEESGRLYFAMEYVAGETLADRVARGPIGPDDALAVIRSAALGLREAERNGITHRDVKPSNLMIDSHGLVKVLDFGLAAGAPTSAPGSGPASSGPVAQTSLAGTPLYMAPEQARGEHVDFRSDVYALGATLYHLVSGRPPFEADSLDALLSKHASALRPALPRRSGTPRTTIAAIDALCGRMMARTPSDRFGSYDELIRAIELASVEHVRPAGFWVRLMAAGIDLLCALLLSVGGMALVSVLASRSNHDDGGLVLTAYAIACTVLTVRKGRTPGKALFELEVVEAATGRRPGWRRAATRVIVPIAIMWVSAMVAFASSVVGSKAGHWTEAGEIIGGCVGPAALLWASLRTHSKRTFWDRWSGTLVCYRTRRSSAI